MQKLFTMDLTHCRLGQQIEHNGVDILLRECRFDPVMLV